MFVLVASWSTYDWNVQFSCSIYIDVCLQDMCMCGVSPNHIHVSSVFVCSCFNFLFACGIHLFALSCCWCSCWFLGLACLSLNFLCFLWNLLCGSSVHWCLIRLNFAACGSWETCLMCFAVDLDDSSFLANCLTLLAGNLSKSMLESLIVFDTKSSSLRKNQNMSLCKILAVSCGYLPKLICACTALYYSPTECSSWQNWLASQTYL